MKKLLILSLYLLSSILQAQTCEDSNRFIVNGKEINDTETGLIWQRCTIGQSGNKCNQGKVKKHTWKQALQVAKKQNQKTGKHWRFPNFQELGTIVNKYCNDKVFFLNNKAYKYWTAVQNDDGSYNETNLYFNLGTEPLIGSHRYVRLVRIK